MTCENCVSFRVCHAVALAGKMVNAEVQCDYFVDKDLINRQKAEIERLEMVIGAIEDHINPLPFETDYAKAIRQAKAEAVKEFAERLKEELEGEYIKATNKLENAQNIVVSTNIKIVDNLVKEMVGEG